MKPAPFDYFDPTTVEETLGLLGEFGDEAKLLAGGQSLMPMLNLRLARPSKLVDINGVTALAHLGTDGDDLLIGALTRQRTLEDADLPDGAWSLLPRALHHVGHVHIRNRGTVGGSIAHADPAAELPAAFCALGARMVIRGPSGEREVPADDVLPRLLHHRGRPRRAADGDPRPTVADAQRGRVRRGGPPPRRLRPGRGGRRPGDRRRGRGAQGRDRRGGRRDRARDRRRRRRRPGRATARRGPGRRSWPPSSPRASNHPPTCTAPPSTAANSSATCSPARSTSPSAPRSPDPETPWTPPDRSP